MSEDNTITLDEVRNRRTVVSEASWGLKVTDRNLARYEELAHFNHKDIPKGGRFLNVGSGYSQALERDFKKVRSDVQVISVDPSVVEKVFWAIDENGKMVKRFNSEERRMTLPNKENTVPALGQALPFADNTFDMAVDVHGPAQYSKDEDIYKKYLNEVVRTLKPGGKFHIFNTYFGDPLIGDEASEKECMDMQRSICEELGLKAEVFLQSSDTSKGDKRVGLIITK